MIRLLYILTCCLITQNFSTHHIFAKETLNANGQPSEYAFQMEVIAIFKQLLSKVYPDLHYHVLSETKEYDDTGQRRRRLDILVRGGNQPAYGFELVVEASKTIFDEHYQKPSYYGKVHSCSMVMVHFTCSGKLCNYFGPDNEDVTVIHVIYNKKEAKLVEKDWEETVYIQGADWQVLFE